MTNVGQAYGIEATDGNGGVVIGIDVLVPPGTALAPGQSFTLHEISPNNELNTFLVNGDVPAMTPQPVSRTTTIDSSKPIAGANARLIGFSFVIHCQGAPDFTLNGVVKQGF